jgi:divalent metal cation (Fe/Co/Zn/Cd) transporter
VTSDDGRLIQDLARRNWWIFGTMLLTSLLFRSRAVTVGVLGGGLTVIVGFQTLHRSLKRLLANPDKQSGNVFLWGTIPRLLCLACAVFLLIGPLEAQPLALVVGLSVVVINLLWTTLVRSLA